VSSGNVTVKVYRVPYARAKAGCQFVVAWKSPTGRQRKTYSDADTALDEAALKAHQLNAGQHGAASMSDSDRAELQEARSLAADVPVLAALREWRAAHDLTRGQLLPAAQAWSAKHAGGTQRITAALALKRYLAARRAAGINVAAGPERTFMPRRGPAVARGFLPTLGDRQLAELTPDDLALWLANFAHPVTHNTHRRRLVAFFRWCRRRGYLPLDVMTAAERTDPAMEDDDSHVEILNLTQIRRAFELITAKAPHYLPVLALATLAGLRRIELHGQDWRDIDLARGFLRVTKVKPRTPARRQVPILPALAAWLRPHARRSGPICDNLALDRIRDICRTAGLALADNGFRHTWISARVQTTGDKARTALEAGTSVKMIDRHYLEVMTPAEAAAILAFQPPMAA
jgi:integrase